MAIENAFGKSVFVFFFSKMILKNGTKLDTKKVISKILKSILLLLICLIILYFSKIKQSYQTHFSIFVLFFSKIKIATKRIFNFHFFLNEHKNFKHKNSKTKTEKWNNYQTTPNTLTIILHTMTIIGGNTNHCTWYTNKALETQH